MVELMKQLHNLEIFYRLENDEEGFYLTIINREVYPRIWSDNSKDSFIIISETTEHLLERTFLCGRGWEERFFGYTLEEVFSKTKNWYLNK